MTGVLPIRVHPRIESCQQSSHPAENDHLRNVPARTGVHQQLYNVGFDVILWNEMKYFIILYVTDESIIVERKVLVRVMAAMFAACRVWLWVDKQSLPCVDLAQTATKLTVFMRPFVL